jgi:adhesin/invasin
VAPSGTTLAITANPARIDLTGTSTVTVFGQKANGSPLDPGTVVRFSTDKGSIDATGTIQNGQTTAIFRGDGSSGTATITATAGASTTATTKVQVGQSDVKPTVLVSVNPNNIPVLGTATVTVIARNSDGTPLQSGKAILTTNLGTLKNSNPDIVGGIATTILTAGTQAGMATVTALTGASDPAMAMLTIRDAATSITLQVQPQSVQNNADTTVALTAFVFNAQQQPVQGATVTFSATKGTLSPIVATTDSTGKASSTLSLKVADLTGTKKITVTASTPSGAEKSLTDSVDITVNAPTGG